MVNNAVSPSPARRAGRSHHRREFRSPTQVACPVKKVRGVVLQAHHHVLQNRVRRTARASPARQAPRNRILVRSSRDARPRAHSAGGLLEGSCLAGKRQRDRLIDHLCGSGHFCELAGPGRAVLTCSANAFMRAPPWRTVGSAVWSQGEAGLGPGHLVLVELMHFTKSAALLLFGLVLVQRDRPGLTGRGATASGPACSAGT